MDDGQGLGQGEVITSSDAKTVVREAPVTEGSPNERIFRQQEVNDIVKRAKHAAVEDFKRIVTEQPEYAQQKYGDLGFQKQDRASSFHEQDVRRLAAEEAQRLRDEWMNEARKNAENEEAKRIVNNFTSKIASGKESYEDFDSVVNDIDYRQFPHVVHLLADYVDNAQDVLYELGKDRLKMAQLEFLCEKSPQDAISHAKKLGDSIRKNRETSNIRLPNEPLSQLRPSNSGTSGGVLTVSDYRKKYRG